MFSKDYLIFDIITLAFVMVREASILFYVSSDFLVPFWFYEIERSSSVRTSLVSCHQILFASLKHRDENCFQYTN